MTVQEFKIKYPALAHLEGNELWDAMTNAVILEKGAPILSGQEAEDYFKEHFCDNRPFEEKFSNFGLLIPMGNGGEPPIIRYIPEPNTNPNEHTNIL